jgi:phage-related protein
MPIKEKEIEWVGSSQDDLREFPRTARQAGGHQLAKVQEGLDPDDFKPMMSIGPGAYEIRVHDDGNNEFRVIYVAKFEECLYVLHAFQKKSKTTPKKDIDLAKDRYKDILASRKKK